MSTGGASTTAASGAAILASGLGPEASGMHSSAHLVAPPRSSAQKPTNEELGAIEKDLKILQQQHLAIASLNTDPKDFEKNIAPRINQTWGALNGSIQEALERIRFVAYTASNIPVAGLSARQATEQSRVMAEQVLDVAGYTEAFSPYLSKLSDRAAGAVISSIIPRIAAEGAKALQAYLEKSRPWITGLESAEAIARVADEKIRRAQPIQTLRQEALDRVTKSLSLADVLQTIPGTGVDLESSLKNAIEPAQGRVDLLALKGLREYARTSADLTPEGAKLVSDLCSAAIKIGNRINSDIFSSDFARTISAIRAMEAETGKRGEARYVSFMEEFQLAADRFNQANPQKFLPPALLSSAAIELRKVFDPATGEVIAAEVERIERLVSSESVLKIPGSRERVSPEHKEFCRTCLSELDLPTECIDSAAWAHELEAIQPAPEIETDLLVSPTIPLRSSLTTALTGDVKFTHGVSLNFEVPADASGKVTIKNTYTKQQVVFEFGTREAPAAVLNALVPLKDKIAQAVTHGSVTPGLFEEIAAVLTANADAIPVVEQKKEFVSGVLQAAPGAKGSRLSITSEGFSDDLVKLLRSSESAELAYQSPDKAVGWNAIRIERDYTGVFVTMSSDGVAGKVAPASMKFRVDDGSSDRTAMSDKFRWFFGLINSGGLARPQIGSGAFGTGTVVDRFYEKCELQEASNVALAKVTTPEIKLSATAKLENVRIIDGEFSLVGKGDGNQAQLDGVTFEGSSKVTLVGLEGSKLKETVAQKTASLQGSLSRSQFEGCYFWGESAGTLELNDITWKKGTKNELPGLAPKNAKLA